MASIVYIVLAVATVAVAIAAVLWPLLQAQSKAGTAPAAEESRRNELEAQRDAIYHTLREIEFDYRTGKMDENDYRTFDMQLKSQAVAVLQQLDHLNGSTQPVADLDAQIESEIAALRRKVAPAEKVKLTTTPITQSVNAKAESSITCPHCGQVLPQEARFCLECGTPVSSLVQSGNSPIQQAEGRGQSAQPSRRGEVG